MTNRSSTIVTSRELKRVLDPTCSYGWCLTSSTKRFAIVVVLQEGITFMMEESLGIGLGTGGTDTYFTNLFFEHIYPEDAQDNRRRKESSPLEKIPDDREYAQVYFVFNKKGKEVFERIAREFSKNVLTSVQIPERPTDAWGVALLSPDKHSIHILDRESQAFEADSAGLTPFRNMADHFRSIDPTIWFHIASSIHQHFDEVTEDGRARVAFLAYCNADPEYLDRNGSKIVQPIEQWIENQKVDEGTIAIAYQPRFPDIEILLRLLNAGAGVDAVDTDGNSGLMLLLSKRHVNSQAFGMLLGIGAGVNLRNKHGRSAPFL